MLTAFAVPLAIAFALGDASAAGFALRGKVLDPTRAPVAKARVTATSADQRSTPTTETDANGEFTLALAPRELQRQGHGYPASWRFRRR